MKLSRRHESLIPLSREHHYGLMLCMRIHRGLAVGAADETWVRQKAGQTAEFFVSDLVAHFKVEEEVLFPAMQGFADSSDLLSQLLTEHRKLADFAERLSGTDVNELVDALQEFADLLEAHIRKEEGQLFPLYERFVSGEVAADVGYSVKSAIGDASQPRNAELLK
jgi:hemerythrin-like domain-containing protein